MANTPKKVVPGSKGRVFLLDDQQLLRQSLASLLVSGGFVVQAYSNAAEFLADLATNLPNWPFPRCVISDINMPGISGLELQKQLEAYPNLPIVFMSGIKKPDNVVQAFRAGAVDFLVKPVEAEQLFESIDIAMRRSEALAQANDSQASLCQMRERLTDRELAVVRLAAQGWLNKQIADELGMALRTVKLHRQNALAKLGLQKTLQLVPLFEAGAL